MRDQQLKGLRCRLVQSSELWQFDLMDSRKLWQFASNRGIGLFNYRTIEDLWRLGLLRADAVTGDREIKRPSLKPVHIERDGTYLYCDTRKLRPKKNGFGGVLSKSPKIRKDIRVLFHPFRLYVLYHIERVFSSNISSTQYLVNPGGLFSLPKTHIDFLDKWTSSKEFCELFDNWNKTAELAIVCEPASYERVFQGVRWRLPDTQETIQEKLDKYRRNIRSAIISEDTKNIEKLRKDLCINAELLDRNKLTHILLRLMSRHERLKLRSSLGGSMVLLSMAEVIRRSLEDALSLQLPEEDELGFGQWVKGAREEIFGTERVLDASKETRRDFLTSMQLDFGVKVRCYVEGETELGALGSALDGIGGIEFVNLRGEVIERRGKGISFANSLKNDMKSHIFSVVMIDEDREDYVKALKNTVRREQFFGRFFISSPDFEFANFSIEELLDVILLLAADENTELSNRDELLSQVAGTCSASEFLKTVNAVLGGRFQKGEAWGEALMNYAVQHPTDPRSAEDDGTQRQLIQAARVIFIATQAGYARSHAKYKVDPDTGDLVAR